MQSFLAQRRQGFFWLEFRVGLPAVQGAHAGYEQVHASVVVRYPRRGRAQLFGVGGVRPVPLGSRH